MNALLDNWMLIPLGMTIATVASLIGIGGGLLWAPYFILVRGFDPAKAIMFSFLIQVVGMGSATFWNIRHRTVYWRLLAGMALPIAAGVLLGAFFNQRVANPDIVKGMLGITTIAVSIFFVFQTEKYDTSLEEDRGIKAPWWFRIQGLFFGILSGFLSIGISDFLIPVMRSRLKIPMNYAVGTALFLNFSIAFMGSVFHLTFTEHAFTAEMITILVFCWIGAMIGGQFGRMLSSVIDDSRLKEIFIFALLIIGIHLIYNTL